MIATDGVFYYYYDNYYYTLLKLLHFNDHSAKKIDEKY